MVTTFTTSFSRISSNRMGRFFPSERNLNAGSFGQGVPISKLCLETNTISPRFRRPRKAIRFFEGCIGLVERVACPFVTMAESETVLQRLRILRATSCSLDHYEESVLYNNLSME